MNGELKKKRLLVTGGAGFIGSNYIRETLSSSEAERIVNLDVLTYAGLRENLEDLEEDPRYRFLQGDIGEEEKVNRLLKEEAIDTVVHFAAESHVDRSIDSPEPFFQTNVIGTLRLLNAFRQHVASGGKEKDGFRFVHVSTDEVYGSLGPEDPAFHESRKYEPNSPYSASKAGSDHIVRAFHHTYGLPVLTTNCSNNYGPYQFPEKLIPLMILNALEEKPLPIYGDGLNVRDWLYVVDHCRGINRVLEQGTPGETYNIGGRSEKANIEVVDTLCDILDSHEPRKGGGSYRELKTYVKDRPGHDRRYAVNCDRIRDELGWVPEESFESGIRRTVEWYLANREWCRSISERKYSRDRLGLSG